MLVVIGTDCIGSRQSNYHTIMTTSDPCINWYTYVLSYDARYKLNGNQSLKPCNKMWYFLYLQCGPGEI
jgi:hypothetical protein